MLKKLWACALLALFMSLAGPALAADNTWLFGDWIKTYDPDGDPQDKLTFSVDGKFVTTEVFSGRQIGGQYSVQPKLIKVELVQQGKVLMKLELTYDEKREKLYYKSGSSGNTAYYEKAK